MKTYNLKQQEKNTYCVPSVLQAIFDKYGIKMEQDMIAGFLTPTEKGFKISDDDAKEFIDSMGFNYEFHNHNATLFNEPDMLLKEMDKKDIFMIWRNHTVLGVKFEDPRVHYIDPIDKVPHHRILALDTMLGRMNYYKDGFFGVLERL